MAEEFFNMPVPKSVVRIFFACAMVCGVSIVSHAQELDGLWDLRIADTKHSVKVVATIRLTEKIASESCMGGTWKRVAIEAKTVQDERFFPLAEPIAYQLENGALTLGGTAMCDRYSLLSGKSDASNIQGTYNAVGLGTSHALGFFSLKRVRY
ncbi:hypothetical protein RugamoR57_04860 [Duganella caerulea]|uniref:hypothetical protein n=1 Tax=Duganella caerulea TaxID=2885762 RepID=UPI0030E7A420